MTHDLNWIRKRYDAAGQGHVFTFWDKLSAAERDTLLIQLAEIDVERVNRVYRKAVSSDAPISPTSDAHKPEDRIEPLPEDALESTLDAPPERVAEWRAKGLDAIARGKVGVLLMAGGQGTRLGSSAPKGCYDIGLPSHRSLFEYQALRIARLQELAGQGAVLPWYIMTSGPTRPETVAFFERHAFFGLDPMNVIFFEQGTLPCLSMDGKILLETASRVAVAPDGNGGLYAALRSPLHPADTKHTVMTDLKARGIEYLHAYCVDNCLVRVADPVFLGCCIAKGCDCGAKVVRKTSATESVGVVARRGSAFSVVEYSEISPADAARTDPRRPGELAFRAANIANHFYATSFLAREADFEEQMAFHIARKKIPTVDLATGELLRPAKPNGMKLELFVFDVFPFTQHFGVLEVARVDEFSPLKNAPGTGADDPQTSRRDLIAQHRRWLEAAGASLGDGVEIEISPRLSYAGEGLEAVKGKKFTRSGHVEELAGFSALE